MIIINLPLQNLIYKKNNVIIDIKKDSKHLITNIQSSN